MCAPLAQPADQVFDLALQFERGQRLHGAENDGRDQRHGKRRHDLTDLAHQHLTEPLDFGEAAALVERAEIDAVLGAVWRSEIGRPKLTQA